MSNKEKVQFRGEHERNPDALAEAGKERSRELHEQLKENLEKSPENAEDLKQEALEKALSKEKEEKQVEAERRTQGPISKLEKEASFNTTMKEVRGQMSTPSRTFSKVIHNKTVEKVSESIGETVARPNAILSGAIFAFILTLGVYLLAKNLGYSLSGFETIAAFVLGWALGIVYDFLKVMITGRK